MSKPGYDSEAAMCADFIAHLPEGWTAYPETEGFDLVLVRGADGFQIGVEAKLKLNGKVICQAAESQSYYSVAHPAPDCRAVLIPDGVSFDLAPVCTYLGITVIRIMPPDDVQRRYHRHPFRPGLPKLEQTIWGNSDWYEFAPAQRLALPDWIPDVVAGDTAPIALTSWKVAAIKIVVTLERRGVVTRQDFAHFQISMSRWSQQRWLVKAGAGGWIAGPHLPDFRKQHPRNFEEIGADFEKWARKDAPLLMVTAQ